jgi:hypothetical protein
VNRLAEVVAPSLRGDSLDVREVTGASGEVRELLVTSPSSLRRGRVTVDSQGSLWWEFRADLRSDAGAVTLTAVITALLAERSRPAEDMAGTPGKADDRDGLVRALNALDGRGEGR